MTAETPSSAAPAPPATATLAAPLRAVPGGRAAWIVGGLLAVVAIAAFALGWQADRRLQTLERELVRRQNESSAQAAEARLVARQSDEAVRAAAAKVALLEARVSEVAVQRSQLEDLIQSFTRSRDENLIVDIEASLRVALQQAALTGSAEPLVATLRQSDERLARYNQPRLEGVRRAIARDLDKVRATGVTDIAVLTIRLDEAIRLVDDLPLVAGVDARPEPRRAPRPAVAASSAAAASAPAGWAVRAQTLWSSWWDTLWDEARALVRVQRIDAPDALLLEPEHALFVRENLKLRLLNARLALLSRQFAVAQADLGVAQAALERYFDRGARRTQSATELVRQVAAQSRQVVLPRPDDTLAALAAVAAGR